MKVLILAGGLATRMGNLTRNVPKSLLPINNIPFAQYQINFFKKQGFVNFVFLIGHYGSFIKDYFSDGSKLGVNIEYSDDGIHPIGTYNAIFNALNIVNESFIVVYGDSYINTNIVDFISRYKKNKYRNLMAITKSSTFYEASNVKLLDDKLIKYNKNFKSSDMKYIDYGISVINKEDYISKKNCFNDFSDFMQHMSNENNLFGYDVNAEQIYEIGSKQGYNKFIDYVGSNKDKFNDIC